MIEENQYPFGIRDGYIPEFCTPFGTNRGCIPGIDTLADTERGSLPKFTGLVDAEKGAKFNTKVICNPERVSFFENIPPSSTERACIFQLEFGLNPQVIIFLPYTSSSERKTKVYLHLRGTQLIMKSLSF